MITQIKRKKCLDKYSVFPTRTYIKAIDNEEIFFPDTFADYILTFQSKTYAKHIKSLRIEIDKLMKFMGWDALIFLGDVDLPWRFREGRYKQYDKSLKYLANQNIKKRFKGALLIERKDIPLFIPHLVDLIRTNGIVQYVFFTDPNQDVVCSFCQYTNFHVSTLNEQIDFYFGKFVEESQFEYTDKNDCYNKFDAKGKLRKDI